MFKLNVIIASTREGRVGPAIARWFVEVARQHPQFEVTLVDLKEANLPLIDEPNHPRLRQYTREHTRAWSRSVGAADAFVFVTPEYNYGMAPSLLNALDYVFHEWAYTPAGFVSYGGLSGGMRSVQMAKLVLTSLKMVPLPEAVTLPFFKTMMDAAGAFDGGEANAKAAGVMLDELSRWATALAALRAGVRATLT